MAGVAANIEIAASAAAVQLRGPIVVALAYYLGAEVAFYVGTLSDQIFALFWPPNVVLFCALAIVPQRIWWRYVAAVFPAHVIAETGVGMPAPQLIVAFATNCAVAVLSAYLTHRVVGDLPWFTTFRRTYRYILIAVGLSPAVSALGGAFVPILGGGPLASYWIYWSHWYLANALPSLTLGPMFFIWFADGAKWFRWQPLRRMVEPAVLAVVHVGACVLAVMAADQSTMTSLLPAILLLPLPPILWATVRFGERGASAAILIVAIVLTWRTLHGPGLFPGEEPEESVLALQFFLTGLSIPVLLLGAVINELRVAERTTRKLTASLMSAQDEERRRIARDLHDSTGQHLIAATLIAGRIEGVVPEAVRPALLQLEDVLQQSIREIRTTSYVLHPPFLDEAGLELALRNFVEGYSERSGIAVDLDISADIDRLPADVELVLFRVVQEALTNVSRHSNSPTAYIRVARERVAGGAEVTLTVMDAGRGMPDTGGLHRPIGRTEIRAHGEGVGLASMRERLNQIGARLEIDSSASGTTLKAVVPIAG